MALFSIGYGLLLASRWCEYFKGACTGRTKFALKDDWFYWLNLGIGRVCVCVCVSSWQRVKKWDGEVAIFFCCFEIFEYCWVILQVTKAGYGGTRNTRIQESDEDHCSWILNDTVYVVFFLKCSWDHTGVQNDPITSNQRNIWVHTNELNPSVWPWILKSVNLKNYQTFQLIPLVVSGVIRLSIFSETMQMYGKIWRISLIIVHFLVGNIMTPVVSIELVLCMLPRHATHVSAERSPICWSPDGRESIDFRYWTKKGLINSKINDSNDVFSCLFNAYISKLYWLHHPFVTYLIYHIVVLNVLSSNSCFIHVPPCVSWTIGKKLFEATMRWKERSIEEMCAKVT